MILFLFSDDSPGNTSAVIIGGALGGLLGSIALVLIFVFLLVIAMRKLQQKEIGENVHGALIM